MSPSKAKQHPDKAQDAKLRAMLAKTGRKDADSADLSTRAKRLAVIGTDRQAYRDAGGTLEE